MAKNLCITCKEDSGKYRICPKCYEASIEPCPVCKAPTHQITVMGKRRKNKTCVPCTTRESADTRRIGKTCKVCNQRKRTVDEFFQVCDKCQSVKSSCPICHNQMPKYIKRGNLRKFCSRQCAKIAHPTTFEQAKKANKTRFKNHIYKSHQNKIARHSQKYTAWRLAVFERDNYTCQDCDNHNHKGNGKTIELHPHHIKPFATFPKLRYEISNGITLCKECHKKKHANTFIGRNKKTN